MFCFYLYMGVHDLSSVGFGFYLHIRLVSSASGKDLPSTRQSHAEGIHGGVGAGLGVGLSYVLHYAPRFQKPCISTPSKP